MNDLMVSHFVDPREDIPSQISEVAELPIQLGFYSPGPFFDQDHDEIRQICDDHGVDIRSVHAPTVDIFDGSSDYFKMLNIIRNSYDVYNVTLHPKRGNPFDAFKFFDKHIETLHDFGMALMYENFDDSAPNGRWLPRAKNIYTSPCDYVFITYDTSHVSLHRNIVSDLEDTAYRLGMVHLSDRTKDEKHLPVGEGGQDLEEVIDYISNTRVFVCLEYHGRNEKLREDYHRLFPALD